MAKVTIFYENSFGIMCEWSGSVKMKRDDYAVITFSANKVLGYDLKNSGFFLVGKTKLKTKFSELPNTGKIILSFDDDLREKILRHMKDNIAIHWDGKTLKQYD